MQFFRYSKNGLYMDPQGLQKFFSVEQQEEMSVPDCKKLISTYEQRKPLQSENKMSYAGKNQLIHIMKFWKYYA